MKWRNIMLLSLLCLSCAGLYAQENMKVNLKSASNLNGNLNCSKELEHYAS